MAKKSSARAKVVKPQQELPSIEEVFVELKNPMVEQLKVQCQIANRVDNLSNLRDLAINFWKYDPQADDGELFRTSKEMLDLSIEIYRKIKERFEELTIEDLMKPELDDILSDLVPKPDDIDSSRALLNAIVIWLSVQPYAGKLIQMHQLFQEELRKRA